MEILKNNREIDKKSGVKTLLTVVNSTVFEGLLANPEQITFTVLFVGLLVYVMKTNDVREKQYRETITQLSTALGSLKDIESKVDKIKEYIDRKKVE